MNESLDKSEQTTTRMKRKVLLTTAIAATAVLVGWSTYELNTAQVSPSYTARTNQQKAGGIYGAMEYYRQIMGNVYTGEIELEDVIAMRAAMRKLTQNNSKNADINWVSMGPDNVGGRVRAILPYKENPNIVLAGGVSGGLFRTTDAGQNWTRLPGFSENLAVSSIARLGNGAIYVGTGNSREGIDGSGGSGFVGGGLFVSSDDGNTWNIVSNFAPTPWSLNSNWATTDCIVADPVNPNKLWVGTNFGLFPYFHGNTTLEPLPNGLTAGLTKDIAISSDGTHILTMLGSRLFVSTDSGNNFTQMTPANNNFPNTGNGATEMAISPDNKNFMYVSVAQPNGYLRGIWATTNAGQFWHVIAPNSNNGQLSFDPFFNGLSAQGWYDNMITVVPGLPAGLQQVIMGGIRMWRWTLNTPVPGITAWEEVNSNFASFPGGPPSPFYVHSDIHTDAWDSQNRLWIGCDGGIFRSDNNGFTWNNINRDFTTTQYYAIAFDPNGRVLGGLQDNGSLLITLQGATPKQAVQFSGGDGFDCEISQYYPNFMFSTLYFGTIFRSVNGGQSTSALPIVANTGNDFYTDIALHEHPDNENSQVFVTFSPAGDNPYLQPVPGGFEVTANGDTIVRRIPAGTLVIIDASNNPGTVSKVLEQDLNFYSYYRRVIGNTTTILSGVADTVLIQERAQFTLAAALSVGIFVTRQPLKSNAPPAWFRVANPESAPATSIEWSPDGNHLYVGFANGTLVRYSNFNNAWTGSALTFGATNPNYALTRTVIHSGPGAITDIEVDYSLGRGNEGPVSERVVITHGGYGGSAKVRVSETAASALGQGTFTNIWNVPQAILGMPVYSVVMDVVDPNKILVGTEYGIWYTDNNGQSWTEANNGEMNRVPVHDLRQQKLPSWMVSNSGVVYAGSHGRGVFRTDYLQVLTNTSDAVATKLPALGGLKVFPNPLVSDASVQFDLGASSDVTLRIFSITGQLVKTIQQQRVEQGRDKIVRFDASDLPAGTYVIQVAANGATQSGKFIKSGR